MHALKVREALGHTGSEVAAKVMQRPNDMLVLVYWIGAGGFVVGSALFVDTVTFAVALLCRCGSQC